MLRWLSSSKHRHSVSTGNSLHRISLDLSGDSATASCHSNTSPSSGQGSSCSAQRSSSVATPETVRKGRAFGSLKRRSLPALHLQEDQSAAIMSNPPVFANPLRRRGCCDHQHTQQMTQYRAEAIMREQATQHPSYRVSLEAV